MVELGKPDFRGEYDEHSRRAESAEYLVLLGLTAELLVALFTIPQPIEKLLIIAANFLIVLGVWGELRHGRKAREAADKLLAESDLKVAEATKQAAGANERLAKANEKLAILQKKLAPRRLTLEQKQSLQSLVGKYEAIDVAGWIGMEPRILMAEIAFALQEVGIRIRTFQIPLQFPIIGIVLYDLSRIPGVSTSPISEALAATGLWGGMTIFDPPPVIGSRGVPMILIGEKPSAATPANVADPFALFVQMVDRPNAPQDALKP